MEFTEVIKIDLRTIATAEDFERLREDNNIPYDKLDGVKLVELKKKLDIIYMDAKTYNVFAKVLKREKEIIFCSPFEDFLKNMEPLKFKKKRKKPIDLDVILEKIHKQGFDSLNSWEKKCLEEHSKNSSF